jgi:hypothetical protein
MPASLAATSTDRQDSLAGPTAAGGVWHIAGGVLTTPCSLTAVPSRGFLFSGSVADNIRFCRPEASRAEVEAAARAVGADQVIAGLSHP